MRATNLTAEAAPVIVDLGGDTGRVVATRIGSDLVIDIGLLREVDLGLDLEAADGEIRLTGMNRSAVSHSEMTLEGGRLTARTRGPGTQRITAGLDGESSRVWIRATADGTVVIERWIE